MKKALITGITGQDGSYLAELLLDKGYQVHGIVRRASFFNRQRIKHLLKSDTDSGYTGGEKGNLILHYGDLTDSASIEKVIKEIQPNEVYNLAAQSHVRISFDIPENTSNVVALGTLRILEAIKNFCPNARFYQASSSEMFGKVSEVPQTEKTPFHPRSPYGCAKAHAYYLTINYREAYGIHASNGILFNHESERRGESFVTKKITGALARIKLGLQKELYLGNLDAQRDWGHTKDYVEAMWLMLQQDEPDDYVIGTGEKHSVREFLEIAAKELGLDLKSNNAKGIHEQYLDSKGTPVILISSQYFRPSEVDLLLADPSKAKEKLNWEPKIKFTELIKEMIDYDLKHAKFEAGIFEDLKDKNIKKSKKIIHNGETIAIVLNNSQGDPIKTGINFLTEEDNPLQTGILNHPKGHIIPPHIHNNFPRTITQTQEMLYLENGKIKVTFYDTDETIIQSEILEPGDLVLLMKKGHGFEMLEDSKIIYVKQGPYLGKDNDKKIYGDELI